MRSRAVTKRGVRVGVRQAICACLSRTYFSTIFSALMSSTPMYFSGKPPGS